MQITHFKFWLGEAEIKLVLTWRYRPYPPPGGKELKEERTWRYVQ